MASVPGLDPSSPAQLQALDRAVATLLVVRASGHPADGQRRYPRWELDNGSLQRLLARGVGGVILLGGSAAELRLRTRQLTAWAPQPLLLCADVEEGVGQRFEGASWLVPPLALARIHADAPAAALDLARRYGACTGREARELGLNWVLAPVCDVNNNPANPVINVRAWGEDPATAGALAAAFCRGVQAEGVLGCAKHFPGHGDTASDSHLELPLLPHDRARLDALELPPFRDAIAAGVAAVMTAHLLLPALDSAHPATLSPAVLTGLLREELRFDGLIVTDALVMEAIAGRYGASEAALLALEAGADLLLMPGDAEGAIDAIVAAVRSGRLPLERLEASLERRRRALERNDAVQGGRQLAAMDDASPLGALSNGPSPADRGLALELVQRSLELQGPMPVRGGPGVNLIRLDNGLGCPFLPATAPALTLPAAAGLRLCLIDGQGPSPWSGDRDAPLALERLGEGAVLLQLFVRGNPFRGRADGPDPWPAVIRQLQTAGRLAGLAVYGSPYAWEALRPQLEPTVPAAWSPGQMPLAQSEVLGRLGFAAAGHGPQGAGSEATTDFTD
ncbi:glycoside hydrolase family 3 N-terminal domain-containing protein [Synechococcus sp. CCY 9618]|uniref:glycoside hydrolase family 3 N-terminal domain-containing protein n=1 Tax=Synechococcus sp. CCY 9618 TaxID=2815602 RepID=UPI001C21C656|nr:glycoside hydrolase family 3 N-terminal domain-containing protein [Synechococcus sp. CCY 9618]